MWNLVDNCDATTIFNINETRIESHNKTRKVLSSKSNRQVGVISGAALSVSYIALIPSFLIFARKGM